MHRSKPILSIFHTKIFNTKQSKQSLERLLNGLMASPLSAQFINPVQWKQLGLYNYLEVIKNPIHLNEVNFKLKNDMYKNVQDCLHDIQLIFQNSKLYNKGNEWIEDLTFKCQNLFQKLIKNYFPMVKATIPLEKKNQKRNKKEQKTVNIDVDSIRLPTDQTQLQNLFKQDTTNCQSPKHQKNKINRKSNKIKYQQINILQTKQICEKRNELMKIVPILNVKQVECIYLVIKSECPHSISTDKNGNSQIDIERLTEDVLNKILCFTNSNQQKQEKNSIERKKKPKRFLQKTRFNI